MPTISINQPEPSDEAKKVIEEDKRLRKVLRVESADREFRPFWGTNAQPAPSHVAARAPIDNGWGGSFDLAGVFDEVADEIDTWVRGTKTPAATTQSTPSKGGSAS